MNMTPEQRAAMDRAKKAIGHKVFRTHGWLHTHETSKAAKELPRYKPATGCK